MVESRGDSVQPETQTNPMPRREFIKRSLTASSGVFIGMAVGDPLKTPMLVNNSMPLKSASGNGGCNNGVGNGSDCLPPGLENNGRDDLDNDDGPGDAPGNPGNQGGNKA
jgi:hypothetical protein